MKRGITPALPLADREHKEASSALIGGWRRHKQYGCALTRKLSLEPSENETKMLALGTHSGQHMFAVGGVFSIPPLHFTPSGYIIFLLPIQWLLVPRALKSQANNAKDGSKGSVLRWTGLFCGQIYMSNQFRSNSGVRWDRNRKA